MSGVDPYAPIRRLPFVLANAETNEQGELMLFWQLGVSLLDGAQRPFQSKYNEVSSYPGQPEMVFVVLQQPGAHKYDTMLGAYRLDPSGVRVGQTVMGTLVNDPMTAPVRQTSSARQNWADVSTAAAVLLAAYGAGALLGSIAAGGGAAAAGGAAGAGGSAAGGAAGGAVGGGAAGGAAGGAIGATTGAGGAVSVAGAGTGFTLQSAISYLRLGSSIYGGLQQIRSFIEARNPEIVPTQPSAIAREDGFLHHPDGTRSMPAPGVAYVTDRGSVIVNNGDGTFAIVDRASGAVQLVNYPRDADAGAGDADAGAGEFNPGELIQPIADFWGKLSTSERIGLASLAVLTIRTLRAR